MSGPGHSHVKTTTKDAEPKVVAPRTSESRASERVSVSSLEFPRDATSTAGVKSPKAERATVIAARDTTTTSEPKHERAERHLAASPRDATSTAGVNEKTRVHSRPEVTETSAGPSDFAKHYQFSGPYPGVGIIHPSTPLGQRALEQKTQEVDYGLANIGIGMATAPWTAATGEVLEVTPGKGFGIRQATPFERGVAVVGTIAPAARGLARAESFVALASNEASIGSMGRVAGASTLANAAGNMQRVNDGIGRATAAKDLAGHKRRLEAERIALWRIEYV